MNTIQFDNTSIHKVIKKPQLIFYVRNYPENKIKASCDDLLSYFLHIKKHKIIKINYNDCAKA